MRIRNLLVYYGNDTIKDIQKDFHDDLASHLEIIVDTSDVIGVTVNDNYRPSGRVSNDEKVRRQDGVLIRDKLCQKLADYNMVRPSKYWNYDVNNHSVGV